MKPIVRWVLAAAIALAAASGVRAAADPPATDRGVIRLAQPSGPAADADDASGRAPGSLAEGRRGFDVQAFDGRFDGLWFQRKVYARERRDADAIRQSELLHDFVGDEGVRRLEVPAGALVLESESWLREGSRDKALASLALAESLDPGRAQIARARARVLSAFGAGIFPTAAEWLRAAQLALSAARDPAWLHEAAFLLVLALAVLTALFALFMALAHQVALRHDVEEWLIGRHHEAWAQAGGWAVLLLPLVVWVGAGWLIFYWIAVTFRYMRSAERALAIVLLLAMAGVTPAYRYTVGLYGLAADPAVRTTLDAANGGYDPDRVVKLRALVDAHPNEPVYRFLLAGLYKNGRYFEDAFEEYRRVLDQAPSTYQAHINLGNIFFAIGQYGEAMTHYRRALQTRPDSVLAHYDMYLAQSDSFKLKEAAESLSRVREIDPEETNRLLSSGSRSEGEAKVVDAAIDIGSIWRATVEGRQARDWLGADPAETTGAGVLDGLLHPVDVAAVLTLLTCAVLAFAFSGRAAAQPCLRCGRPFCPDCKSNRDTHPYCDQCVHLFVLRDGLAPETKSRKMYEIEHHERWRRIGRRLAGVLLPGGSHLLSGRAWSGAALALAWTLAWVAAAPEILGPLERFIGLDLHIASLRSGPIPAISGLDAATLVGIPLGIAAWMAAALTARRPGRA